MALAMDSATTLDLLGGVFSSCTSSCTGELDIETTASDLKLDFEMSAPRGWEKRLDLKAGRFYYVNLSTGRRSYAHPHSWNQLESSENELDLKLNLGQSRIPPPRSFISTIEAVEEALKRSSVSNNTPNRKRKTIEVSSTTSTTSSTSSSSGSKLSLSDQSQISVVADSNSQAGIFSNIVLSGCKRCLMYVMLTRSDPRCPKCGTAVVIDIPMEQLPSKKPRLELNLL